VRFALIPALLAATLITLSACGDSGEGGEVDITLKEWSLEPSVVTLPDGAIIFNTKNDGPDEDHELVIIKTDFAADELPTKDASGLNVEGTVREVEPGDENSGSYTLDPGKYVLICNRVNEIDGQKTAHYAQGMRAAFTVTASE